MVRNAYTVDTCCLKFCGPRKKTGDIWPLKPEVFTRSQGIFKSISRTWKGRGARLKPSSIAEKKNITDCKIFILCISISCIICCISKIINIDIHVHLITVVCKQHFMGMYSHTLLFAQCTDLWKLIWCTFNVYPCRSHLFSNIDHQFNLQSVRLVN